MKMKLLSKSRRNVGYFIPLFLGMYLFKIWPCVQVILTSFKTEYNYSTKTYSHMGFSNYTQILNDSDFINSIINTGIYVVIVVLAIVIIATLLSWCLFRIKWVSNMLQFFVFLPLISSDIAIGMSWRYIFSDRGIINSILSALSYNGIGWLSDKNISLLIFILYGIWFSLPMATLLLLSALQRLNKNLLIAAKLDKASEMKIFVQIGVQHLKSTIFTVTIINCISSWLAFNGLFPLFSGLPGPYYNLYTVVYYIYEKIGDGNRAVGEACAASVLLLVFVSIFLIMRCLCGDAKKEQKESLISS